MTCAFDANKMMKKARFDWTSQLNDFINWLPFSNIYISCLLYKLMTTIDALHATMTKGKNEGGLIKYYSKNVKILLEHDTPKDREFDFFASPSTPSDLLESFQARNEIAHVYDTHGSMLDLRNGDECTHGLRELRDSQRNVGP